MIAQLKEKYHTTEYSETVQSFKFEWFPPNTWSIRQAQCLKLQFHTATKLVALKGIL
jgi:hypothetical protein